MPRKEPKILKKSLPFRLKPGWFAQMGIAAGCGGCGGRTKFNEMSFWRYADDRKLKTYIRCNPCGRREAVEGPV